MAGVHAYRDTNDAFEDVVARHAPLVKRIAHHLLGRLPSNVLVDDLIQAGMIGLLEAAQKYSPEKGASFETYAGIRIRGAMLDEIRRGDWAPRSVHRNARRIAAAIREVEARNGIEAADADVAEALGVDIAEYHTMLKDLSGTRLASFDELMESDDGAARDLAAADADAPAQGHERLAFERRLAEAIAELPEREQLVLSLYYDEELNLKEIGAVLGVSESRVSQIHTQAALKLRARLAEWG